jgi:hypothetical protein
VHPSFSLLTSLLTIQLRGWSWQVCLSQFGPLGKSCTFLVNDYVAGGTAFTIVRRSFPEQLAMTILRRPLASPQSL